MNLGGPSSLDHVEPFLTNLLSDPEIIKIPFQKYIGSLLAKRRAWKVKEQYQMIGGGSPILRWTDLQGKLLCQGLDKESPETAPHKHYIGFRYADPLTEEALVNIKRDDVHRVVVFSQYPQYSCSTTGSSVNELYRKIMKMDLNIRWSVIDRWYTNPKLVQCFVKLIQNALDEHYTKEEREDVYLIFSAHSLPMSVVNRGDAYPLEIGATVTSVMEKMGFSNQYLLSWQSKVGPAAWLRPSTLESMLNLSKKGRKNQLLIPIAFTSDHIETLYEYDIQYAEEAKKHGIKLRRAKSLNDNPLFIETMINIVKNHITNPKHGKQFEETCAGCKNEYCKPAKKLFH